MHNFAMMEFVKCSDFKFLSLVLSKWALIDIVDTNVHIKKTKIDVNQAAPSNEFPQSHIQHLK